MLTFNRFNSFNVIFNFIQCCTYERFYKVIINVPISEAFYCICVGAITFADMIIKESRVLSYLYRFFPGKV